MKDLTRRGFIAGTAGAVAAGAVGSSARAMPKPQAGAVSYAHQQFALPDPAQSGIDHIVVVMMENRSFDHYLGWLPGADGKQAGLTFTDKAGAAHQTHHLTVPHGCGFADPDHSFDGGRSEFNDGACDGWLRTGSNDELSIGYFEQADLDFYGRAAPEWTVCDRYFAGIMAPTYPNRIFLHSAQTDRMDTTLQLAIMPTIWDLLAAKGVAANYYFTDAPFVALWGTKYLGISKSIGDFYTDAAAGTLPSVSFVDPGFLGEELEGTAEDEHPLADIRLGQSFLGRVHDAVVGSPNWERTALVVTYDEWGGFFDHVPPPVGPDPNPLLGAGLRGFRVPCVMISPRARRGYVAHNLYDHTSILKMIEWRFGLESLSVRDAAANNLAEVLDFTNPPNLTAPKYNIPTPTVAACVAPNHVHSGEDWPELVEHARKLGFDVPS